MKSTTTTTIATKLLCQSTNTSASNTGKINSIIKQLQRYQFVGYNNHQRQQQQQQQRNQQEKKEQPCDCCFSWNNNNNNNNNNKYYNDNNNNNSNKYQQNQSLLVTMLTQQQLKLYSYNKNNFNNNTNYYNYQQFVCFSSSSNNDNDNDNDVNENTTTTTVFSSEYEYHSIADETLEHYQDEIEQVLEDHFDDDDNDIDFEILLASGVLTMTFPPHGTWVINKQTPNQQLWWSSPISGPKRYEYDPIMNDWIYTRSSSDDNSGSAIQGGGGGQESLLSKALQDEIYQIYNVHVNLSKS